MKKKLLIPFMILPLFLLSSCGKEEFPYEGNKMSLEKPEKIEILNEGIDLITLSEDDFDYFYSTYLKDTTFLETDTILFSVSSVSLWYQDREIPLGVSSTTLGNLYIRDLEKSTNYLLIVIKDNLIHYILCFREIPYPVARCAFV